MVWLGHTISNNVRVEGLEPARREALDPKSSMSTNFITPALNISRTTSKNLKAKIVFKSWGKNILSYFFLSLMIVVNLYFN